jgi:hypothetical protein
VLRQKIDVCVEINFGGVIAEVVRRTAERLHHLGNRESGLIRVREVTASRGKVLRAEPVSLLYEKGRVLHRRGLDQLEAEMMSFSREWDRAVDRSPNRQSHVRHAIGVCRLRAFDQRVRAGLVRARREGKRLGRPSIAADVEQRILTALKASKSIQKTAEEGGVNASTVQRVKRRFDGGSVAGCSGDKPVLTATSPEQPSSDPGAIGS